jgi:hypothetical protein
MQEVTYGAPCTLAPPQPAIDAVASTCPSAKPLCPKTGQKGGHTPSQNTCAHGSIPTVVQQFPQPIGDPHIVQKANNGPPIPSSILPLYSEPFHLLEQRIGKMLPGPLVQVGLRPCAERGGNGRICQGSL